LPLPVLCRCLFLPSSLRTITTAVIPIGATQNCRHPDRSEAQWRDPRISSLPVLRRCLFSAVIPTGVWRVLCARRSRRACPERSRRNPDTARVHLNRPRLSPHKLPFIAHRSQLIAETKKRRRPPAKTPANPHPKAHIISPFCFNQLQNQIGRIVSQESAVGFSSLSREPRFSCCQAHRRQKIPLTRTPSTTSLRKIVGIVVMLHGV
jgi:hypothetical protein